MAQSENEKKRVSFFGNESPHNRYIVSILKSRNCEVHFTEQFDDIEKQLEGKSHPDMVFLDNSLINIKLKDSLKTRRKEFESSSTVFVLLGPYSKEAIKTALSIDCSELLGLPLDHELIDSILTRYRERNEKTKYSYK
jgi:response regulator of citrate/malate metabolism